jgi:hypothetical protein
MFWIIFPVFQAVEKLDSFVQRTSISIAEDVTGNIISHREYTFKNIIHK